MADPTVLSKPYIITDPKKQAEDIDRMFDELYRALQTGQVSAAASGGNAAGITLAQVSARVLHEL